VSILVLSIIFVSIFVKDDNIMTIINISLIFILLVTSLIYRKYIFAYNNMAKIAKLIIAQDEPVNYVKNIIDNEYKLTNDSFVLYSKTDVFSIYYRNAKLENYQFKKIYQIEIVVLIRKEDYDFYSKAIEAEINKLEASIPKKERPTKYIIIEFKGITKMDDNIKKEISEIVSYKVGKQYYCQINVGLHKINKKAYFLYSNSYYPSVYYKKGIELIQKLIE